MMQHLDFPLQHVFFFLAAALNCTSWNEIALSLAISLFSWQNIQPFLWVSKKKLSCGLLIPSGLGSWKRTAWRRKSCRYLICAGYCNALFVFSSVLYSQAWRNDVSFIFLCVPSLKPSLLSVKPLMQTKASMLFPYTWFLLLHTVG